jgi:glycosyltransferase involved in cell wall biosynthesis
MKIAVIAPSFVPSSAANSIQVMKVCQSLVQTGADVALWVPLQSGKASLPQWDELRSFYGIDTEYPIFGVKENLQFKRYDFAWKAVRAAKQWGAEVIYTWMVQVGIFAQWSGMFPALELHMLPTGRLGPLLLKFFSKSKRQLLLPITDALQQRLSSSFGICFSENHSLVVPMGSEPDRYANLESPSESRQKLGLEDRITAVYTGHLYEGRGMEMLLALAKAYPEVSFLWVGGREPELSQWRSIVKNESVENVTLTGFVPNEKLPLYQSAGDILLMPYQRNVGVSGSGDTADVCSPMKLFDYLSAGRVIISSDLPVFHEVLTVENAVFCAPDHVSDWVAAFGYLLEDPEERESLAMQAKQDAVRYSWLARAQRTLAKLNNLL